MAETRCPHYHLTKADLKSQPTRKEENTHTQKDYQALTQKMHLKSEQPMMVWNSAMETLSEYVLFLFFRKNGCLLSSARWTRVQKCFLWSLVALICVVQTLKQLFFLNPKGFPFWEPLHSWWGMAHKEYLICWILTCCNWLWETWPIEVEPGVFLFNYQW